jgi:ribosomal protein L32E
MIKKFKMTEKKKPKFKRKDSHKYSKLGKGRKNKQTWRKPTGRHNKMRNQMKGHPAVVAIGYKTDNKIRNTIQDKKPVYVYNVKDITKLKQNEIAVLGKIGNRNKLEIANKAKELGIKISNLNENKFLKKVKKKTGVKK